MFIFRYLLICTGLLFAEIQNCSLDLKKFEKIVNKIFEKRSGFLVPQDEIKKMAESGACSTYGEILPASLDTLFSFMSAQWLKDSYFVDLGSGVGKAVLQAGFYFKKSIGVELSDTRDTHAQEGLKQFKEEYQDLSSFNVEFRKDNMLTTDLSCDNKPTFVFLCSTCFNSVDPTFMKKLVERLESFQNIHVVVSLNKMSFNQDTFEYIGSTNIPMTWTNGVNAYFYIRKDIQNMSFGCLYEKLNPLKSKKTLSES